MTAQCELAKVSSAQCEEPISYLYLYPYLYLYLYPYLYLYLYLYPYLYLYLLVRCSLVRSLVRLFAR